jgi:hypothetical protein
MHDPAPTSLDSVLDDQSRCWHDGEPQPVEELLRRQPALAAQADALLELIYHEVLLREQHGEKPQYEEYARRFAHLAEPLRFQFEIHFGRAQIIPAASADKTTTFVQSRGTREMLVELRESGLLTPAQSAELRNQPHGDVRGLGRELLRRGWLTPYQVNEVVLGRARQLLVGSYVVRAHLGEGGMGAVYQAWHRKLERIVALKVIRQGVENDELRQRFLREMRAAAKLSHPNIIRAHDADHDGQTYFLVMEYVAGSDLAKKVRQRGPLPVSEACEYVRQTALGLQHIMERGLVHRDIKPSNLLVTQEGVVKVLDLGLARFGGKSCGANTSTFTELGRVMGTPDYIAPEQTLDTHKVDIRADLYSLGCTFYHLLTGRPPFAGVPAMEKMLKHQKESPAPVQARRPGLPVDVAAVVSKLMAKRPGDRFQTPSELAKALSELRATHDSATVVGSAAQAPTSLVAAATDVASSAPGGKTAGGRLAIFSGRWIWGLVAVAGAGLLCVIALALWIALVSNNSAAGKADTGQVAGRLLASWTMPGRCWMNSVWNRRWEWSSSAGSYCASACHTPARRRHSAPAKSSGRCPRRWTP